MGRLHTPTYAVTMHGDIEFEGDYSAAWEEWAASDAEAEWESVVADGLGN